MARAKKSTGEIEAFRAALGAARGKTARSSLYRWLRVNHDQFLEDWTEAADWPAFVQAFATLGLTDRTGKPPVPETARKTWLQVRKDIAKAKAGLVKRAPPLAHGEIAPGVRANQPLEQALDDTPWPRISLDIRPARPRLETPATGGTLSPSETQGSPGVPPGQRSISKGSSPTEEEVEANMRCVREQMNANKVPAPKPV